MNKYIIIVFLIILLGFMGFLIYSCTSSENLEDTTSVEDVPIIEPQDLTQLTLQHMQQNMTELPRGYLLPPPRTKFQCLLPSLIY